MIKKIVDLLNTIVRAFAVVWIVAMGGLFAYIFREKPIALLVIIGAVVALLFRALRKSRPILETQSASTPNRMQSRVDALNGKSDASNSSTAKSDGLSSKPSPKNQKDFAELDAIIAAYHAWSDDPQRAKTKPAWALIMQSPFAQNPNATSWLGGLPVAPANFEWPRDTDGKPLSFIAQIDLADVNPEATTGLRPEGLPERGALLAFMGLSYAFRVISGEDMVDAKPVIQPPDLVSLEDHGFWIKEQLFPKWPVTLVPFMDHGNGRPVEFPDRFKNVEHWITNWGIAALEAEAVSKMLENNIRNAAEILTRLGKENTATDTKVMRSNRDYWRMKDSHLPALLEKMKAWLTVARSHPPESPIDRMALKEIMAVRLSVKDKFQDGHLNELAGDLESVWSRGPLSRLRKATPTNLPDYLRPLIKARIEDWRGHRLMGLEPEFPNNSEDIRGQDPVLSINSDDLLQTQTEHDYGFSMWCKREDIARGQFNNGQFIRHCAV